MARLEVPPPAAPGGRARIPRAPARRLVPILFTFLLLPSGQGHAQSTPRAQGGRATGWIEPEEVSVRADALRRRLEAAEPDASARATLERIERDLALLGPDLDAVLEQATAALARWTSFLGLQDQRSQLAATASPLAAWEETLVAEGNRVAQVLDEIARARRVWSETLSRPETVAAGALVERRVQASLEALDDAAASLRAWRERVLVLSERLADRRDAVDAMLERLRVASLAERANLFVPSRPPLWHSEFGVGLRRELPHVPGEIRSYARGTRAYVERDPRPLVVQLLLAALLMIGFRRLSTRAPERLGSSRATRLLERPYSSGLLFALLAAPALHPLAPQRFMQLLGTIALLPAARIVVHATGRGNLAAFAGPFALLLFDRLALALAPLPAVARASFLLVLVTAFGLAFWLERRARRAGDPLWMHRAAELAMLGLALAILAEVGGWANLAALLGRGIVASAVVALYVYASAVSLEPVLVYFSSSHALHRSHLLERNTAVLQRGVERGLRGLGAALWLYLVLRSVGLRDSAAGVLRALLQVGVSVGALSLSIGSVLAFVLTLLAALFLARIVNGVLEEDVYPRTNLPRGIPHALSTLVRYGVYSLGFLLALAAAGVQLSQLTILLGGLGVGIGLGLQDLVKNFAAGLTLLLERRVHVGDALNISSQEIFGRVLSIGMRATVVRNWNGSEVVVPNADLVSGAVTNWTLSDRLCRIEFPIGVAYGTDPARVVALLLDVARANDHVLQTPAPQALFKGFGDSSLDFLMRAWTDQEYERIASLTSELALAVHGSLYEAGIAIPFPQRDLHLASVSPEVRVALSNPADDAGRGRPTGEASK